MEAYQAYLRGRFLAGQPHFTLSTWLTAVDAFERAVDLDPNFALAWAELSRAHARLVYFRYDISPQRRERAQHALGRARELAPGSPDVHLAAGYYHLWVERNAEEALAEFEAASRGLPNSAEVLDLAGGRRRCERGGVVSNFCRSRRTPSMAYRTSSTSLTSICC